MSTQSPIADRAHVLARLANEEFDVLVVGGGITGSGIARDATLRGLRVALIEQDDFASGTSSRSSRLVHGGLRYLEHGQLRLVFESSAERTLLLRMAPHLVWPLEFVWPVYAGARIARWKLEAGLLLYDALALFRNAGTHRPLSAQQVLEREPHLRRERLRGGARYFDAATNDARLTIANAIDASEQGAAVLNHARVQSLRVTAGRVTGARVVDAHGRRNASGGTDDDIEVRARVVVNATGPWSDVVRRLDGTEMTTGVRGSKGVHIELPRARLGNRGALTLLSPLDGRVMFVLPADANTIVGTTETYTAASPGDVRPSASDVEYLLTSANAFFPDARLTTEDVVSAWAGIRPLVATAGADPGRASREHAITRSPHGMISITGGKLTTYRIMAAQVVDQVESALGRAPRATPTARRPLPGGDIRSVDDTIAAAGSATGDDALARHLVRAHGSRWTDVWREIDASDGCRRRVVPDLPYTMGELCYGVKRELARTLADLLVRRTHVAFETRDHGRGVAPEVARLIAPLLGWNAASAQLAIERYEQDVRRLFAIDAG